MHTLDSNRLTQLVKDIKELALSLGLEYLSNHSSRHRFFSEIEKLTSYVENEVKINCMSLNGAINILNKELDFLKEQRFRIVSGRAIQYAKMEKIKIDRGMNIALKQVGFIGGGTQVVAGYGVCAASLGFACAAFGSPLIAHGLNNVYENGHYLLFRKDKVGFARGAYRYVAGKLGFSDKDADYAYYGVDLALSAYGMGRNVLREDSFRLFKHINNDFIVGWREMGKVPLLTEISVDGATSYGIYKMSQEGK